MAALDDRKRHRLGVWDGKVWILMKVKAEVSNVTEDSTQH